MAEATYPSYDANDYGADRGRGPGPFHRPDRLQGLRARVRLQDADRHRRPRVRHGRRWPTKINDTGTLEARRRARRKIDDADHVAMGSMTFEDADRLLAQRRRGEGRRSVWRRRRAGSHRSARHVAQARLRRPTGDRRRGRGRGHRARSGRADVARDRPRQRSLRAGRRRHARSSWPMPTPPWSTAAILVTPHVVKAVGGQPETVTDPRAGDATQLCPGDSMELMHHVARRRPVLPGPDADPGLRRRRQDRHGADLGFSGEGDWKPNKFNYSFVGYIGRRIGHPDLVVAVRIDEGTPRRQAWWPVSRCRSCHSSCSGGSRPTRSASRTCCRNWPRWLPRPAGSAIDHHGSSSAAVIQASFLCHTSGRVRPLRVRATGSHRPGEWRTVEALSADDLIGLTGGRLIRDSLRPIRGAAVDSRLVRPGELFVALPGERTDGHRFLREAVCAGAAALLVATDPDDATLSAPRRRDDRRASPDPLCGAPARSPPPGAPLRAARRRHHGQHREDVHEGGRRGRPDGATDVRSAPRATRTTRSACRSPCCDSAPEHGAAVLEMGMYAGGEIARPGRDRPADDRRRDGGPGRSPVADRHRSRRSRTPRPSCVEALPAGRRRSPILNADDPRVRWHACRGRRRGS